MKKICTLIFLIVAAKAFSQTDNNGNPVFNSVTTKEETVKDFTLISNYYMLKTNIDDKNSSVYISDKPTLAEVEYAAINLPSDFFIITKRQHALNLVMLQNYPVRQFFVVNPETGKQDIYPCQVKGDITEHRANEIIKERYDPKARIEKDQLIFNNKKLAIMSTEEIRRAALELIEKEKLAAADSSGLKILTKEELTALVVAESKEGGKLDFFTEIKGHEYDGILVKEGLFTTKLGIALYKWGKANFELGVNTAEDALANWKEWKGRAPNQRELDYITKGFNRELEK